MPPPFPPPFPPPGFAPPPPPPRRPRGILRPIIVGVVTLVIIAAVIGGLYAFFSNLPGGAGLRTTTVANGDPGQKVAVVPVTGVLMGDSSQRFNRLITTLEQDSTVKAVVLEIDTPGGAVTPSDEMWKRVQTLKAARPGLKVVASMGSVAASGGYYVACAADYIVAEPTTMTGSIGVMLPRWNLSKFGEKYGVEDGTIVATGATFKDAGSMFRADKPEELAYLRGITDQMFARFKDVVDKGRAGKLTKPLDQIANGKVYLGPEAKALGLVDDIKYPSEAYTIAANMAGLTKPTVVRYQEPPSLFDLLSSSRTAVPPAAAGSGTVNGINVNVNLDAAGVHEMMTPRLMYLWQGN
jgi:protease-4